MSSTVHTSESSRHLLVRISGGDVLPDALMATLNEEQVACGWLRASGVLVDVELRAFDAALGTLGSARRLAGPVQVLAMEGSIGLAEGQPSLSLRALLSRETDRGLETLAGEITRARAVGLEVLVTALDDVAVERSLDDSAGVWLLGAAGAPTGATRPARPAASAASAASPAAAPAAWNTALEASERAPEPQRPRVPVAPGSSPSIGAQAPMPQRIAKRAEVETEEFLPDPGDVVDHFAFGRADVAKSDGDRLHVRIHKDGRIKEIALEMLRVTRLPDLEDGKRHFKLERRI